MTDTGRTRAERALAAVIHEIRPDWQEPGIVVALRHVTDRPMPDVAAAALYCAIKRTDQRTPDCIRQTGEHWQAIENMTGKQPAAAVQAPYLAPYERGPEEPAATPDTIRAIRAQYQPTEGEQQA